MEYEAVFQDSQTATAWADRLDRITDRYGRGTYTSITRIIYTRLCSGHRIGPVCHTSVCTLSATSSHLISTISDTRTSKYKLSADGLPITHKKKAVSPNLSDLQPLFYYGTNRVRKCLQKS